jgi:hypothetical protein
MMKKGTKQTTMEMLLKKVALSQEEQQQVMGDESLCMCYCS